jgi:glutamyl-tRNA synthetase
MSNIVDRIFPNPLPTPEELAIRFPKRDLPVGAMVTRVGPSPTGFMHIGTLYVGRICAHFARETGGVSILRIEDTDKKREVEGAVDFITHAFDHFGVTFDEGVDNDGNDKGAYGPYRQSQRMEIYQAYVKHLLATGKAYPCFASGEELEAMRDKQQLRKMRTGYYGVWAEWRDRPEEDVQAALDAGTPFVIRFRAEGKIERKMKFEDLLFGERKLPENDQDIVVMKADGLPTYHFAHAVDDHLMGTTHVIRGDEWLSSIPTHLQLFEALGWDAPEYAHIAPINKMDDTSRRKLSKRKDPEASVGYFEELGYSNEAVLDYLMTLADANFEDWSKENPETSSWEFPLTMRGLKGSSGPLFDFEKLGHISRNFVSTLKSDELYDRVLPWAKTHDTDLATLMTADPDRSRAIMAIERDEAQNPRKDIEKWSDVKGELAYFFDDRFTLTADEARAMLDYLNADELAALVTEFLEGYDPSDDNQTWFGKMKELGGKHGFALRPKDFKQNPDDYKGTVAHVAKIFRVLLAGKERSPDLYSIMQVMGPEQVKARASLVL